MSAGFVRTLGENPPRLQRMGRALEAMLESVLPPVWRHLLERVRAGERLTAADGVRLITTDRLFWLGALAAEARRLRVGNQVFFAASYPLNCSRICARLNRQTASGKVKHVPDGPTEAIELILAEAQLYAARGAAEVRLVGGPRPELPFDWHLRLLRRLENALPRLSLRAYTPADLLQLARVGRLPLTETIRELKNAGLDSLLGGGAVIFSRRVRGMILKPGDTADQWLDVHETAHRLGVRSNATVVYGHIETPEEIVDHLIQLRQQQDRTGGFQALIPVGLQPAPVEEPAAMSGTTGYQDLRVVATARLLLDNFRFIQPCRAATSARLAQLALTFGANDVDEPVSRDELLSLIWEAGLAPAERDAGYNVIREYPAAPPADWRPFLIGGTLQAEGVAR